jgi:hypothetical protein
MQISDEPVEGVWAGLADVAAAGLADSVALGRESDQAAGWLALSSPGPIS